MANQSDSLGPILSRLMGVYLVLLNLGLVYVLVKIWPGTVPFGPRNNVFFLWGHRAGVDLWIETRYLLIVAVVGALGSYIHLATSFADFMGNRQFVSSWMWWYLVRPFIGTALALVLYFAVRGGLITGNAGAENLSPYGIAAIAGLAGMFSKQAADKLREVFEDLFKTTPIPRSDPLVTTPVESNQLEK
jgi:hypothetical protein